MNQNCCRICLNDNELESLHQKQELDNEIKTTARILEEISHIKILENDQLPQYTCCDCKNEIIRSYNFKQLIIESDIYLRNLFQETVEVDPATDPKIENNYILCEVQEDASENISIKSDRAISMDFDDSEIEEKPQISSFKFTSTYTEHEQIEVFMCSICNPQKTFSTLENMKRHQKNHHPEGTFKCSSCERVFKFETDLKHHESKKVMGMCAKAPSEQARKCFLCDEMFETVKLKNEHIKTDHADEDVLWKCLECEFESRSAFSFEKHTMHHQTGFDYFCSKCGRNFTSRSKLKYHMDGFHNERPEEEKFVCDICGSKLKCKQYLLKHIKAVHFGEKKYKCPAADCSISYASQSAMGQHMYSVHNVEPPLRCADCMQGFTFQSEVRFHNCTNSGGSKTRKTCQRRNMGSDAYCEICQKEFRSMSTYYRHYDVQHKNIRKYECSFCSKTFALRTGLLVHERTHTGEKPFACQCGSAFSDPSTLYKHIRTKHPERLNVVCKECDNRFPDKITLRNHMRLVHPDEWRLVKADFEKELKSVKKVKKYNI